MRNTVDVLSDRLLSMFVPKAKAGACACGSWDNGWYYYCVGGVRWKAYCTLTCNCAMSCFQQQSTNEACDQG